MVRIRTPDPIPSGQSCDIIFIVPQGEYRQLGVSNLFRQDSRKSLRIITIRSGGAGPLFLVQFLNLKFAIASSVDYISSRTAWEARISMAIVTTEIYPSAT